MGKICRCPPHDLRCLPEFTHLPLQHLDPLALFARGPGPVWSRSACRIQLRSVSPEQLILAAIYWIANHREPCSLPCSRTSRTVRSRSWREKGGVMLRHGYGPHDGRRARSGRGPLRPRDLRPPLRASRAGQGPGRPPARASARATTGHRGRTAPSERRFHAPSSSRDYHVLTKRIRPIPRCALPR